jgi:hypothetical protein
MLALQASVCIASIVIAFFIDADTPILSVLQISYFVSSMLPPFVVCIMLCDALVRIKRCESRKHIK